MTVCVVYCDKNAVRVQLPNDNRTLEAVAAAVFHAALARGASVDGIFAAMLKQSSGTPVPAVKPVVLKGNNG